MPLGGYEALAEFKFSFASEPAVYVCHVIYFFRWNAICRED